MSKDSSIASDFGMFIDKVCRSARGRITTFQDMADCIALLGDMLYSYRKANETLQEPMPEVTVYMDLVGAQKVIHPSHRKIGDIIAGIVGASIQVVSDDNNISKWEISGKQINVIVARRVLWLCLDRWIFFSKQYRYTKAGVTKEKKPTREHYFQDYLSLIERALERGLRGEGCLG